MQKSIRFYGVVNAVVIIVLVSFFCIGPFLRSLVSDVKVSFVVTPTTYDCAGEGCIGFIVVSAAPIKFAGYHAKLLLPYSLIASRDQLNNTWANLLSNPSQSICLEGYVHRFPVGTFRLFHVAHEGYELRLVDYRKAACSSSL